MSEIGVRAGILAVGIAWAAGCGGQVDHVSASGSPDDRRHEQVVRELSVGAFLFENRSS